MKNQSLIVGAVFGLTIGTILTGYGLYSEPKDSCAVVAEAYERAHDRAAHLKGSAGGLSFSEDFGIEIAGVVSRALGVNCLITPEVSK